MSKSISNKILTNQRGQSLVEYMLLLAIIVGISFSFMAGINGALGDRWETMAEVLINIDTTNTTKYKLR